MRSIAKDSKQSVIPITEHLAQVRKRVQVAACEAGRSAESVHILAVSKQQPAAAISAAVAAGQHAFGENYLQEAIPKIATLVGGDLQWHFIGKIQSNKTRAVAEHFDWVHTLDRERIALRLNGQRPGSLAPLNVCIQVKLAAETAKSGIEPGELLALAANVAGLPRLRLRGLMCIPPATERPEGARPYFRRLRQLYEELRAAGYGLDTLSMGMSNDLEVAISEGATLIRIGTAIFGPRPPRAT
jgi:pyridoxal phosphate enzyme (YggS family)